MLGNWAVPALEIRNLEDLSLVHHAGNADPGVDRLFAQRVHQVHDGGDDVVGTARPA